MSLPVEQSKAVLPLYDECYERCYMEKMRNKFGLLKVQDDEDK